MNSDLNFQPWQFMGAGQNLAACAETEISMNDFSRMQTIHTSVKRGGWVPPFALNIEQLKKVLLLRAWRYVYGGSRPFPKTASLQELNRAATKHALANRNIGVGAPALQHQMNASHVLAVKRAGGYLELQAAIAFRCWRLGGDSVTVGESLSVSPCSVRGNLQRLRDKARETGYDVGKEHHARGKKRRKKPGAKAGLAPEMGSYLVAKCTSVGPRRLNNMKTLPGCPTTLVIATQPSAPNSSSLP